MKALVLSSLALVFLIGNSVNADDKWFDMKNCGICKCMADQQELMTEVKWEVFPISNGMMMVATVPEAYKATMEKAHQEMEAAVKRLEGGEHMQLCGFCKSYGSLMEAGAQEEHFSTAAGDITLVTSSDPETVKKIHEHAKKSKAAHEKMISEMRGATGK